MEQTFITLNNGRRIPQFGLGVFMVTGDEATRKVCLDAIRLGYRHIDTAHAYQNERGVGQAVRECGVPREDLWITSKLWPSEYGEGKTLAGIDKMLSRLDTDYIDLLLLHQQFGDYLGAWRDMEKAVATGKVRSIGLSNFESSRLEEVLDAAQIKPATLQVECHPYYQQEALKCRIAPYGTVIESWYPYYLPQVHKPKAFGGEHRHLRLCFDGRRNGGNTQAGQEPTLFHAGFGRTGGAFESIYPGRLNI